MGILDDEPKEAKRSTGVELPEEMLRRLDSLAKARGMSRNKVIVKLLAYALEHAEDEAPAPKKR